MSKYWYGWIEINHDLVELDFLLLLVCAAYIPTITAAHVLINDHTLLLGRHDIFADRWKHLSCGKCYTKFYCTKKRADRGFALIFKICGDIANPWQLKVSWTFFRFFLCR